MGVLDQAQANLESNDYSIIDFNDYRNDNFTIFGFQLSEVLDDIILIQYADAGDDRGTTVLRNGIAITIAHVEKAWRIGKVVLAGHNCRRVKVNDFVCFPSDKGIPCSNLDVEGVGVIKDATFLNEGRIFGICKPGSLNKQNASKSTSSKKLTSTKRSGSKIRKKES